MFPDRDTLPTGLIVGILVPLITFPLLYLLFLGFENLEFMSDQGFRPMFKERTSAIVAIAANSFPMSVYQKRRATDTMRGVVLPTFAFIAVWLYFFWDTILVA